MNLVRFIEAGQTENAFECFVDGSNAFDLSADQLNALEFQREYWQEGMKTRKNFCEYMLQLAGVDPASVKIPTSNPATPPTLSKEEIRRQIQEAVGAGRTAEALELATKHIDDLGSGTSWKSLLPAIKGRWAALQEKKNTGVLSFSEIDRAINGIHVDLLKWAQADASQYKPVETARMVNVESVIQILNKYSLGPDVYWAIEEIKKLIE